MRKAGTSGTKFPSTLGPVPKRGAVIALIMSLLAFISISVETDRIQSTPFPAPTKQQSVNHKNLKCEEEGGRGRGGIHTSDSRLERLEPLLRSCMSALGVIAR